MTTQPTPLHDPGHLLANLPAIFGFYPQESLVLAAFDNVGGHRYRLGPVLRLDLDDEEAFHSLHELADGALAESHTDLLFAFVITRRRRGTEIDEAVDRLLELEDYGVLSVDACWAVPEVLTGERYRLLFGPPPIGADTASAWSAGQVADVVGTQSMQPWIEHGALPELSRSDAAARFAPIGPGERVDDPVDAGELRRWEAFAYRIAFSACEDKHPGQARWLAAVATDLHLLLEEIEATGADAEELVDEAETLVVAAIAMAHSELRDIVAASVLDNADAAAELLLAVARRFRGTIRANALSLHALAMIHRGLPMVANPALVAAQEEAPGHTLSGLLLEASQHGLARKVLRCVEIGSRDTRRHYGLTVHDPVDVVGDAQAA
ncbi:MAG: DUF4192 domain-containing protein [Corynebacterium sp.]|uniref:DUF4192 domain-containing protein n=1 Tax=Corynebacterium sp. TaxID=1720 RepID=UPI00270F55CA|nr:DUF4192 domain-containing protein [Corynebacterium sp.]